MRTLGSRRLLFVLALVFSQCLVVAHAASHPALAVDLSCQICLHAPGIDSGALAAKPATLPLATSTEAPPPAPVAEVRTQSRRHTRIRGPPPLLA